MDNPATPSPGVALPTEGAHPSPHQRGATLTLIGLWLIPTVLIAAVISAFYINAKFSNLWAVLVGFFTGSGLVAVVERVVSWVWGHLLPDNAFKHLGEAIRTRLNLLWQSANHRVAIVSGIAFLLLAVILPFIGLPQFFDPYTQRSWQAQSISFGSWTQNNFCGASDRGYQARANPFTDAQGKQQSQFISCFTDAIPYTNFVYEARMTITEGTCGGLLFRATDTDRHPHVYFFLVCQNGGFALYPFYTGSGPGAFTPPTTWPSGVGCTAPDGTTAQCTLANSTAGAINRGLNQSNLLAVVADGSTLTLWVNRVRLISLEDQSFASGHIGVAADSSSSASTAVVFSSMKVWIL